MKKVRVLHGPNLNLLGIRQTDVYGATSLDDINARLVALARTYSVELAIAQHNSEGDLVDAIQQAYHAQIDFIIINAGALTHTSIAIRDALLAVAIPFIEVHMSNVQQRESFRQVSYLADKALGCIQGFGAYSYELALLAAQHYLTE